MSWLARFSKSGGRSQDRTKEIIDRHIDSDFIAYPMAESVGTEKKMKQIAERFGVRFPAEFVSHVCGVFPGVFVQAQERVWPRPERGDVRPFWTFLYAVHSFTPVERSEDWMRIDRIAEEFQAGSGLRAVPILRRIGDANVYCTDIGGSILRYDHEENTLTPVNSSFWEIFEQEIAELVERKNQMVEMLNGGPYASNE